jgi:hypothetical protein
MVQGKEQLCLEWGPERDQLLLTMNVYSTGGKHVARLRRNTWTFNDHDRFALTTAPGTLTLIDTTTHDLVLEVRVAGRDAVAIPQASFRTVTGQHVEITPEHCRIEGQAATGTVIIGGARAVAIL